MENREGQLLKLTVDIERLMVTFEKDAVDQELHDLVLFGVIIDIEGIDRIKYKSEVAHIMILDPTHTSMGKNLLGDLYHDVVALCANAEARVLFNGMKLSKLDSTDVLDRILEYHNFKK